MQQQLMLTGPPTDVRHVLLWRVRQFRLGGWNIRPGHRIRVEQQADSSLECGVGDLAESIRPLSGFHQRCVEQLQDGYEIGVGVAVTHVWQTVPHLARHACSPTWFTRPGRNRAGRPADAMLAALHQPTMGHCEISRDTSAFSQHLAFHHLGGECEQRVCLVDHAAGLRSGDRSEAVVRLVLLGEQRI